MTTSPANKRAKVANGAAVNGHDVHHNPEDERTTQKETSKNAWQQPGPTAFDFRSTCSFPLSYLSLQTCKN